VLQSAREPALNFQNEKIKHLNLRSRVANNIRTKIISGVLEGDVIYSSADIAIKLGVSITPVREAVLDLARAGLVEVVRNRGFRVVSMSETALDHVAEVRKMLEPSAMGLIVARAKVSELESLRPMIHEMRMLVETDLSNFMIADYNFHIALFSLCGNDRLLRIVIDLCDQTRLKLVGPRKGTATLSSVVDTYEKILNALIEQNVGRATALMREHVDDIRTVWSGG
jgi:DNA-binding GntR family transcriptional regulator